MSSGIGMSMWRDDPQTLAKERAKREISEREGSTFEPGVAADQAIINALRLALASTVITACVWAATTAIDQQTHLSADASAVLVAHKERVHLAALNYAAVGLLVFVAGFASWLVPNPTLRPQCVSALAAAMVLAAFVLIWHAHATFQVIGSAETLCGTSFRGSVLCTETVLSAPTAELGRWLVGGLFFGSAAMQVLGALHALRAVACLRKDEALNAIILSCASCKVRKNRAEWQRLIRDQPVRLV